MLLRGEKGSDTSPLPVTQPRLSLSGYDLSVFVILIRKPLCRPVHITDLIGDRTRDNFHIGQRQIGFIRPGPKSISSFIASGIAPGHSGYSIVEFIFPEQSAYIFIIAAGRADGSRSVQACIDCVDCCCEAPISPPKQFSRLLVADDTSPVA